MSLKAPEGSSKSRCCPASSFQWTNWDPVHIRSSLTTDGPISKRTPSHGTGLGLWFESTPRPDLLHYPQWKLKVSLFRFISKKRNHSLFYCRSISLSMAIRSKTLPPNYTVIKVTWVWFLSPSQNYCRVLTLLLVTTWDDKMPPWWDEAKWML